MRRGVAILHDARRSWRGGREGKRDRERERESEREKERANVCVRERQRDIESSRVEGIESRFQGLGFRV